MSNEQPTAGFEYIDHPADIQVHSWGPTLSEALEQACLALFSEMFDPEGFNESQEYTVTAKGKNLLDLVYTFLGEWLFAFDAHSFVAKSVKVTKCDLENFEVTAVAKGEEFEMEKHEDLCRTEVKAITFANMVVEPARDNKAEIYVILDL